MARDNLKCPAEECSTYLVDASHYSTCYECQANTFGKSRCPECGWAGSEKRILDFPQCRIHLMKLVIDYSERKGVCILDDTSFEPFYSTTAENPHGDGFRHFETRGDYNGWVKQQERLGYHVGPDRADDKPQTKLHKRIADDIAKYGDAAAEHHAKVSAEGRRKETERKKAALA